MGRFISNVGLSYSIKKHVEDYSDIPAIIKFDGVVLPTEKPFVLIEKSMDSNFQAAKQRETIRTVARFQVGIFADTSYGLSDYILRLSDSFLFKELAYYDEDGTKTGRYFVFEPDFKVTQLNNGNTSDETKNHRAYFDLEIVFHKHKNIQGGNINGSRI